MTHTNREDAQPSQVKPHNFFSHMGGDCDVCGVKRDQHTQDVSKELVMEVQLDPMSAARELVALRADRMELIRLRARPLVQDNANLTAKCKQRADMLKIRTRELEDRTAERNRWHERQTETFEALTETIGKLGDRTAEREENSQGWIRAANLAHRLEAQLDKAVAALEMIPKDYPASGPAVLATAVLAEIREEERDD